MLVRDVLFVLLIGYAFRLSNSDRLSGMVEFKHIDIREYGSGNAGTTNVMRTLGKKAGYDQHMLCDVH